MDNLKMFGRYAISVGIGWAVGKGYFNVVQGDALMNFLNETLGVLVAFGPALWASFKVDNTPLPPAA